jgi:hypothetical protein
MIPLLSVLSLRCSLSEAFVETSFATGRRIQSVQLFGGHPCRGRSHWCLVVALLAAAALVAQDPTGTIEGLVTDGSMSIVSDAHVVVRNLDTGFTKEVRTNSGGLFRLAPLPVGQYRLTVDASKFAKFTQEPIVVNVSRTVRLEVLLELATVKESVTVMSDAAMVDSSTNTLGKVVSGREVVDLPLNGRNFTQLGLLQTEVAPLTAGVMIAGGSLRQGQTYAVNGMRPESNLYLLDGARNINRMDGGYALKIPVDAIAEFRILTQTAPAEYGGTSGATTSVVTRAGSNQFHGGLYEFLRNDRLDARNFFSSSVEPLKQNQFGGTVGGPVQQDRLFFFGYYEGFRNKQGFTSSATVPTPTQRSGDFSERGSPLINFAAGGVAFPNNEIPAQAINPIAVKVLQMYPLGNVSPSIYRATVVGTNFFDQAGARMDYNLSPRDQFFLRYSYSGGYNINPISVRGSEVPGFATRDDITTHSAVLSSTHLFSPALSNSLRLTFFRYLFYFDSRLNRTPPSELGFGFNSANDRGQGPRFSTSAVTRRLEEPSRVRATPLKTVTNFRKVSRGFEENTQ